MPKFCIHESHAGVCEKTGNYCNEGVCPYEDMRDFAEEVHGRWIEKTAHDRRQYFECSNCGKQENKHTAIRGGFCWNCGAKMDKEETNELDKREG